ncbi:MAG: LLM class flavin-dependent oxidoreductase [Chloroflexi bacterium]|nr:LLM class flavin-dependent oxidoreductase [Chloroflexota bacterium]
MKIGIALPSNVPGVNPQDLIEWARKTDSGPFSTLAANDRLAYLTGDPLTLLAMAAGVTSRVRLMTSILIAPIRNAGVLATQAATIDSLSNGRLTLGLAVGGREDAYLAGLAPYRNRGNRFDEMLTHMRRIWAGDTFTDDSNPSGPAPIQPGGPEILIGGAAPAAIARVGRSADGFIAGGGGNLDRAREVYDKVLASWAEHGRPGKPRFLSGLSFALGDDATIEQARANQFDYYSWLGEKVAIGRAQGIVTTPEAMRETLAGLESIGVDEVIMQPTHPALEQLDRAAVAVF